MPAPKFSSCEPEYDVPPIPVPNNAALSTTSWLAPRKSIAVCAPVAEATSRTPPAPRSNAPTLAELSAEVTSSDPSTVRAPLSVTLAIALEPVSVQSPPASSLSDWNPQNWPELLIPPIVPDPLNSSIAPPSPLTLPVKVAPAPI